MGEEFKGEMMQQSTPVQTILIMVVRVIKRKNRGGSGSKQRRKQERVGKQMQQQYEREQEALTTLRDLETARKREAQIVRKHEVKEETKSAYPPTLELPPPVLTERKTERTTTLLTNKCETEVEQTIFDNERRLEQQSDNGKYSNILQEIFNDDYTYENCNFQEIVSDNDEIDETQIKELETLWYQRYHRANPDNNKKKFALLHKQPIEHKYGFSQDNIYLSNVYTYERKMIDLVKQEEKEREEATALFNQNQTLARQKERQTKRKEVTLTSQQEQEKTTFRNDYKTEYFKKRRHN